MYLIHMKLQFGELRTSISNSSALLGISSIFFKQSLLGTIPFIEEASAATGMAPSDSSTILIVNRTNVALRYCRWILGNAPTLQNSGSVWRWLVAGAQNLGCFYNAYEDEDLGGAIRDALIELGQQRLLFTADSILFKAAKWKVRFSAGFYESLTRYKDPEIQEAAASLLEKLANGWRHRDRDEEGISIEGEATKLLEWDVVKGMLRLVWIVDIQRENWTDNQVIKVLDILPRFEIAEVVRKFEVLVGEYTVNQLNRCLYKRPEGGMVLPMTWPVDRANSRSNYSSNDLATQLSAMNLRNDPTSPRRRNPSKWRRGNCRGRGRF